MSSFDWQSESDYYCLEIGASAGVDEQGVAGQDTVTHPIGMMAIGVTGGEDRIDTDTAEDQGLAFLDRPIDTGQAIDRGVRDLAPDLALERQGRGDVVGVDVGIECVDEPQADRRQRLEIAPPGRQHRVDEDRLTRLLAAEQIGVGARDGFEELLEDHLGLRTG